MSNSLNITLDQGSTFTYQLVLQNPDTTEFTLDGYTARMMVRATYGGSVLLSLTTENGKLSLGGGIVTISLYPSDTASIRFPSRDDETYECVYDIELVTPSSQVYKPAKGTFTLNREITR